jgi:hypothetical protein
MKSESFWLTIFAVAGLHIVSFWVVMTVAGSPNYVDFAWAWLSAVVNAAAVTAATARRFEYGFLAGLCCYTAAVVGSLFLFAGVSSDPGYPLYFCAALALQGLLTCAAAIEIALMHRDMRSTTRMRTMFALATAAALVLVAGSFYFTDLLSRGVLQFDEQKVPEKQTKLRYRNPVAFERAEMARQEAELAVARGWIFGWLLCSSATNVVIALAAAFSFTGRVNSSGCLLFAFFLAVGAVYLCGALGPAYLPEIDGAQDLPRRFWLVGVLSAVVLVFTLAPLRMCGVIGVGDGRPVARPRTISRRR